MLSYTLILISLKKEQTSYSFPFSNNLINKYIYFLILGVGSAILIDKGLV